MLTEQFCFMNFAAHNFVLYLLAVSKSKFWHCLSSVVQDATLTLTGPSPPVTSAAGGW